jgi:hypothetical protein
MTDLRRIIHPGDDPCKWQRKVRVARFEGLKPLLPQPGGFEGSLAAREHLESNRFAITHRPEVGWSYVNLEAATASAPGQLEEDDDMIVSLEVSVGLGSKLLEGFEVGLEELPQTLVPVEGSGGKPTFGESALDVGVADLQSRVQISAIESFIAPAKVSTFSCDIAYSRSPAASRASWRAR